MTPRRSVWTNVSMGLVYAGFALAGRVVALDDNGAALVWPAAGVALVWLLHETAHGRGQLCLSLQTAVLTGTLAATRASAVLVLSAAVAALVQTVLAAALLRRWCPPAPGAGGIVSVETADHVARGALALTLASLAGALVGGTGLALEAGSSHVMDYVSWWARNLTGLVVVGALGLLLWEHLRGRRSRHLDRWQASELLLLVAASAAAYGFVFTQQELPLVFLLVSCSVWVALRFPTVLAALHTAVFGGLAVALTLVGRGPLGDIGDPAVEAILSQAFLSTTMLAALAIATGRDQRDALAAELASAQRAALARAELLDAMTEAMTEGVAIVAADGEVLSMNTACRVLLTDTPVGAAANARDYEMRRPDGEALDSSEHPFVRALRLGEVPPHDLQLVRKNGGVRTLAVTAAGLTSGDSSGAVVIVFRDVTREREERSDLAAFASAVAHDLRSPLTVIRGRLSLAEMRLSDVLETTQEPRVHDELQSVLRNIEQADNSIVKMSLLIQDLLAQATAEGRGLDSVPVSLSGEGGLVEEVLDLLPHGLHVEVGGIPDVLADPELVRQLLTNVLDNAVKYADPERPLRVTVTGEQVFGQVRIDVADNGVGVPPDQRILVFERFHRAHAGDPRFSGTGLGLALCRTIVERHGGVIECLGTPTGVGTTIRFALPCADPDPGEVIGPTLAASGSAT